MNQQPHRHVFIKNELVPTLFTCFECSCIQYKEKTTLKPHNFNSQYENDPVTSYFTSVNSQTIQWSSEEAKAAKSYLLVRSEGVNQIKAIATRYGLNEHLYHSSIYLLDYLCISFKANYAEDIKRIAALCLVLVAKFYDNGEIGYQLETELFTKEKDAQYKVEEIAILKAINYDLFFVTAYDSLSFLLNNGIIFEDEKKVPKEKVYFSCLLQLNQLVEKQFFVNFAPFQLAFSIIALTRHISGLNARHELLEELYGYDIEHYAECYDRLKSKMKVKQGRKPCSKKNSNERSQRSFIRQESQQHQIGESKEMQLL